MSEQNSFGPYKVLEQLAEGPIARVCRGVHTVTGQKVILRIINPLVSRNERMQAVIEDLRNPHGPHRLDDPSVLRILRVGKEDECFYVAFEDFAGMPLDAFLREQRLGPRDGLNLAILITEALRNIHMRRLVHGDIKPQNILVGRTRDRQLVVKIAMADLAHSAPDAMISIYGELVGTPKYMSPEQIQGKRATPGSDIFALGVIFYELFSGREPFPADNALGYLRANVNTTPAPLAMVETSAPAELDRIVMRMLSQHPSRRYRRADRLLDDLERAETKLDGGVLEAPPAGADSAFTPPPTPAPGQAYSPGPWRAVAIASLTMTALAFAAMLFLLAARYYPERDIPVKSSDGDAARADEDTASSDALLQAMRTTRTPPPDNGTSNVKPPPQENTTPEPDFAGGLRPARQMLLLGKAEDALQQFRELKQRYPDPADQMTLNAEIAKILFEQARSLEGQNRPTEAIALLTEITTSYRNSGWSAQARQSSANILLNQATFQKNQDKLKEATSILDKIIEEFPDTQAGQKAVRERPRLLTRRATRLLSTDPEATVELLRTASAAATEDDAPNINKQFFAALIYRAEWHLRHKRLDECAKDVREFKARNPENTVALKELEPKLLFNRAKALLGEKDYEGALILWKRLRQEYRGSPWIRRGMKEMVGLEKLARSGASNAAIFFKIAEDKRADGKLEDARADYESLAKIFPDSDEARKAEALLSGWDMTEAMDHWRGGRMKQGAAILKQIAKEYPASPLAKQASSELARLAAAPEEMIYVPGGEFIMGLDDTTALKIADLPPSLFEREIGPQILGQKVAVKPFYIDRHEVTNAQYKLFMDDTGAAVPPCPAWVAEAKQIRKGYENYPVTSVAWNEAAAYAKWAKKRLPTEAEWEKAARGIDGRLFPWGNTFAAEKAIVGSASPRPKHPAPVGSAPEGRSPYGAQDMIGNVREWTQDIYKPYAPKDAVSVLLEERNRVVRGAGWHERDTFASLCTSRWPTPPNAKEITLGFRCASSAK